MTVLLILGVSMVALVLAGRFYAPLIGRVLGERAERPTPAVQINDGRDYVPTRTPVVFAHHYASIAGAGPIVGPVIALYFGWGPALAWIILGGIFLGAVHDFAATHITLREGGKNLTVVARRYLGPAAFALLLVLLILVLVLVCAAFLDLSAKALTSQVPVSTLQLPADQTLFRTTDAPLFTAPIGLADGLAQGECSPELGQYLADHGHPLGESAAVTMSDDGTSWTLAGGLSSYHLQLADKGLVISTEHAVIGGVASTSVVVITLCSPLIGFLYLKRKWAVWICSLLAIVICAGSIVAGLYWPMSAAVGPSTWKLMISGYVLISAGLPVWLFLQSRDFINVHILYVGIGLLVVALVAAAIRGGGQLAGMDGIPLQNWGPATTKLGPIWPYLFVTIACGAVSGFHGLCAGGTTCKQLATEPAARHVGFYAMLLESFLAVCVVCCLIVGLSMLDYRMYCHPAVGGGNAVLTFAMAVGQTTHLGLDFIPIAAGALGAMLLLEGFLVTTLDTAIRLMRYMIEEGWATIFGRYDVFANQADATRDAADPDSAAGELVGTGGLTPARIPLRPTEQTGSVIATHGAARLGLRFLQQYWVNSGLAVALMLLLGWGNGYSKIWPIFGSANQLLAALTLLLASCWLVARHRPVLYTLLPALFMLATSVWMLVQLAYKHSQDWPNKAPLVVTEVIVLLMTLGLVLVALFRWRRLGTPPASATAAAR